VDTSLLDLSRLLVRSRPAHPYGLLTQRALGLPLLAPVLGRQAQQHHGLAVGDSTISGLEPPWEELLVEQ